MVSLYFVNETGLSGIHAICIGMCLKLQAEGYRVGYMKPLGHRLHKEEEETYDIDAKYLWEKLELDCSLDCVSPVLLTPQTVYEGFSQNTEGLPVKLTRCFKEVATGKDVMVIQGAFTYSQGALLNLSAFDVQKLFGARTILVERYRDAFIIDNVLLAKKMLGDALSGVIFNMVPAVRKSLVDEKVTPFLEEQGIPVYGNIPEDRILKSVTVADLTKQLSGRVLCAENKKGDLIEGVMIGAMSQEHALSYFRKKMNQCIITGGDRSDIQLAALETNARCLVLTGNLYPSSIILSKAEDLGVPIVLVDMDTLSAAEQAEKVMRSARIHDDKKIDRILDLFDLYVDYKRIISAESIKKGV